MKIKQFFPLSALTASIVMMSSSQAATYEVRELPLAQLGANSFAAGIDESGNVSAIVTGELVQSISNPVRYPFNPVVDYSLVNFDDPFLQLGLTDIDAALAGNPNSADYQFIVTYVDGLRGNPRQQEFALSKVYVGDENGVEQVIPFDQVNPDTGALTDSTNVVVNSGARADSLVGVSTAPQRKIPHVSAEGTNQTFLVRDFSTLAFVKNGDAIIELPPTDTTLGGWSYAYDMNNNGLVAGAMSVAARQNTLDNIDRCADDELRGDRPVEQCNLAQVAVPTNPTTSTPRLQLVMDSPDRISDPDGNPQIRVPNSADAYFQIRGAIWQLNDSGEVVSTRTLGLLEGPFEDRDEETFTYASIATAINDQGNVAGVFATNSDDDNFDRERTNAVAYVGDEVINLIEREEDRLDSRAIDINNANQIIGMEEQRVNGVVREKLFVYDLDDNSLIQPQGFFNGSDTIAYDINDAGLVVGDGQIEFNQAGNLRRRAAFLYDTAADDFQDLNDLVGCDVPYTLIEARGLNENNEIAATARVNRQLRNPITGELQFDDNGDPETGSLFVAVKLVPVPGGQVDDCSEQEAQEISERRGAGMWLGLGALLLALGRRRKTLDQ